MDFWGGMEDVVRSVAPTLGTALAGPLGGMAARWVTTAILGEGGATDDPKAAVAAIQAASPDQLLALKTADNAFAERMKELGVDLERVHAQDRASARTMQATTKSIAPPIIAGVALAGFFGVLACIIFVEIPYTGEQPLNIMLGVLGTLVAQIANFYYGSSKGSADKTMLLGRMVDGSAKDGR